MKKENTNNTPFLPNFDDWARMYSQWSVKNANNLYQIKKRIMNLLVASADRFRGFFDELVAA